MIDATHEKIKGFLQEIKYKPGTLLTVSPKNMGHYWINVSVPARHLNGKEGAFYTKIAKAIPGVGLTRQQIHTLVYNAIHEIERHELDEWFLTRGKHFHHPHPEVKNYKGRKAYL